MAHRSLVAHSIFPDIYHVNIWHAAFGSHCISVSRPDEMLVQGLCLSSWRSICQWRDVSEHLSVTRCIWTSVSDAVDVVCAQAAGQIERVLVSSDVRGKADITCVRLTQQINKASSYKLVAQVPPYCYCCCTTPAMSLPQIFKPTCMQMNQKL